MERDVECEAGIRPAQKPRKKDEMCRAGYREKFGKALYCAKDDRLKNTHRKLNRGSDDVDRGGFLSPPLRRGRRADLINASLP